MVNNGCVAPVACRLPVSEEIGWHPNLPSGGKVCKIVNAVKGWNCRAGGSKVNNRKACATTEGSCVVSPTLTKLQNTVRNCDGSQACAVSEQIPRQPVNVVWKCDACKC